MDLERTDNIIRKRKRRLKEIGAAIMLSGLLVFAFRQLKEPVYRVGKSSVWIETVKRGELLREVSGMGTLVPVNNRLVTANSVGMVEELRVFPGTEVECDTIILVMSNPELLLEAANAQLDLTAAEADFVRFKMQLEGDLLQMESALTQLKAEYAQAKLQADVNAQLFEQGLVAELTYLRSKLNVDQLNERVRLEKRRFDFQTTSMESQITSQQAQLQSVRGRFELLRNQVEALHVKAGFKGVLQQLFVEVGQFVASGTLLAEAADPAELKAIIQISETQAKDITIGKKAIIDTRNGVVRGRVMRVDPSVVNGTVAVDLQLLDALPLGARPDLTVEGKIELEEMADVIFVARPAFARERSSMNLYKMIEGNDAVQTRVEFGRSSIGSIEILSGLEPGDRIIASDTLSFQTHNRIHIK